MSTLRRCLLAFGFVITFPCAVVLGMAAGVWASVGAWYEVYTMYDQEIFDGEE